MREDVSFRLGAFRGILSSPSLSLSVDDLLAILEAFLKGSNGGLMVAGSDAATLLQGFVTVYIVMDYLKRRSCSRRFKPCFWCDGFNRHAEMGCSGDRAITFQSGRYTPLLDGGRCWLLQGADSSTAALSSVAAMVAAPMALFLSDSWATFGFSFWFPARRYSFIRWRIGGLLYGFQGLLSIMGIVPFLVTTYLYKLQGALS